jgi:hypothetical protein
VWFYFPFGAGAVEFAPGAECALVGFKFVFVDLFDESGQFELVGFDVVIAWREAVAFIV